MILLGLSLTLLSSMTLDSASPRFAQAEEAYTAGMNNLADARTAQAYFQRAAQLWDEEWPGSPSAELALARAKAHRLAGNRAAAVRALRQGLAIARHDPRLGQLLELSQEEILAGLPASARQTLIFPEVRSWEDRFSLGDLYWSLVWVWIVHLVLLGRWTFRRDRPSRNLVFLVSLVLVGLAGISVKKSWSRGQEPERAIIWEETHLKKGNGMSYPERLPYRLPPGVEVRLLTVRGDWQQIELADGTTGWVPKFTLGPAYAAETFSDTPDKHAEILGRPS